MKKSDEIEKYDPAMRIVMFDTNGSGQCIPSAVSPEFTRELADEWYKAKDMIWKKTLPEVFAGRCSPVHLYIEYHHMNLPDAAKRMGLSVSVVRKHMTMEGFLGLDLKTLRRYAVVFNIPVGAFFQFMEYRGDIRFDVASHGEGLFQEIKISAAGAGEAKGT